MPREVGQYIDNNFVRGLVTEATGLTFPENACTETFDCVFKKTGEVTRRLGFEYESGYTSAYDTSATAARGENAVVSYLWQGAGDNGDTNFVVVQLGQFLHFYAIGEALTPNKHTTTIDLDSFDVAGTSSPFSYPCSFAQGDGKLFVVGNFINPFYVDYDSGTDTITADTSTSIDIKIRDFRGITSGDISGITAAGTLVIDGFVRPTAGVALDSGTTYHSTNDGAVINAHLYNLMNQGWAEAVYTDAPGQENPVKDWDDSGETTLPGNSDRWWQLKNDTEQMDMGELDKFPILTAKAPKGHFIFSAFDVDRSTVTGSDSTGGSEGFDTLWGRSGTTHGADDLYSTSTDYRPTSVAFFANRVWYSGVGGDNTKVYFSQLLDDISRAGKCYQEQDPTSEDLSDLLPTDGGVIDIPNIAKVVHMAESNNSLYVFATNGIWKITGSEGIGFTAVDFAVTKESSLNNVDNQSFVDLNGVPAWVNSEGIWILQADQTLGSVNVSSISKDSIQSFFEDIPTESIPFIQGTYNARERCVYWLYKSTVGSTTSEQYEYDRCLVFNTETGAFYPWKLNTNSNAKVISTIVSTGFGQEQTEVNVTADSGVDTVTLADLTTNITVETLVATSVAGTTKFLTEDSSGDILWSETRDTDYLDWTTANGTGRNYTSYFITGYKVRGGGLKKQKSNYVRIHSRVESNSGVLVQGVWDYYTSDGARWSISQQGYQSGASQTYSERRLKIRGNGLAVQLRFASEAGKPFNIIGWATEDSINTKP